MTRFLFHMPTINVTLPQMFRLLAILAVGIALQISGGFFNLKGLLWLALGVVLSCAALLKPRFAVLLPSVSEISIRRLLWFALSVFFILNFIVLRLQHDAIDVIIFENDSARSLLHGKDPYGQDVTHRDLYGSEHPFYAPGISENGRVHVGFPYPPLTILWTIPGYILGDVRYTFLFAVGLAAMLMFYMAPNLNGFIAALCLLFVPETPFVLKEGFTDPLAVVTLATTMVFALKAPRLMPFALGLFLVSKQYSILAVPLSALLLRKFSWDEYFRLLASSIAVVAVITIPFILWDPQGLWWSLVGFHLVSPFRPDGLTFSSLLAAHRFIPIPQWFVLLSVLLATWLCFKVAPHTPAGFAGSLALVSLLFFALNKQAFCNYYFFCEGALCLSLATGGFDPLPDRFFGLVSLPSTEL